MSKKAIKADMLECSSGDGRLSLIDLHRPIAKAAGGEYTPGNYCVIGPVDHMRLHGNYRERDTYLEELKAIIDDREQMLKLFYKINNQILAYKRRTDHINDTTKEWLESQLFAIKSQLEEREKLLKKYMIEISKDDPFIMSALGVKGIGHITIAYCLVYIDLEKAKHASSLWAYAGYDKPSHERYQKGVAGGGNKSLRTMLYNMATSQVKTRGSYRDVYDRDKDRRSKSTNIVSSRNTQGKLIEVMWKDTKASHRHGAALRAVCKHFLADYWYVGRTISGLPTDSLYVTEIGPHTIINPKERGWVF
jgi:hypothetical protein